MDASRKPGDTDIVKTQFGYHIMYFVQGEPEWKTTAASQYMADELNNMLDSAAQKWPTEVSYSKIALGERATAEVENTDTATNAATTPATEASDIETEETLETDDVAETDPVEDTAPATEEANETDPTE